MIRGYQCEEKDIPEENIFGMATFPYPYMYSEIGKFIFDMEEHHALFDKGQPCVLSDPRFKNSRFSNEMDLEGMRLEDCLRKISKIKNIKKGHLIYFSSMIVGGDYIYIPNYDHREFNTFMK